MNINAKLVAVASIVVLAAGNWTFAQVEPASPHWSEDGCDACHTGTPTKESFTLNTTDTEMLCESCHGGRGDAIPCRHSSGIPIGDMDIAESLRPFTVDGEVVCSTCHDIVFQCERPKLHFSLQNRGFMRDRTSRSAADYCSKCHEKQALAKLNPHDGVAGSPARPTCLLCHERLPETNDTGNLVVSFNAKHDLNDACRGCHNTIPHPKSMSFSRESNDEWIHLVVPSSDVLARLNMMQAELGIELPLDPQTGEVFCATCHNPHGFKIGGEHGSESKDVRDRLRMDNICQVCHEK